MAAPIGTGRFSVEVRSNSGVRLTSLPYYDMQGTWFLGDQGCNLSFTTHFRNLGLTFANFYPGKHEIWLWDKKVTGYPIFAGPITQITAGSDGRVSVQASDPLWYLSKRTLSTTASYSGKPESAISSLMTYTQSRWTLNTTTVVESSGTQNIAAQYGIGDIPQLSDLFQQLEQMGDGVDYLFRNDGTSFARKFHLWGGKKKTTKTLGLNYPGGALQAYSMELLATGIANYIFVVGSGTGLANFGTASSITKITEYNNIFEESDDAGQYLTTSLNSQAATLLKGKKSAMQIPTIVVRSQYFSPFVDFDLGDQFRVMINDDYVQYQGTVRCIGFQITFGTNDDLTTTIYTNNTEEVT
jgi:hypothetical protein